MLHLSGPSNHFSISLSSIRTTSFFMRIFFPIVIDISFLLLSPIASPCSIMLINCLDDHEPPSVTFPRNSLMDALLSFQYAGRERKSINSTVVGRPVLLALEEVDGSPSFLEKALRFIEDYGKIISHSLLWCFR